MAEDWIADVRRYVANPDERAVAGIVRYCGIALRNRDSSLVSFGDAAETARVRENFLKKKLALTDPDDVLDRAVTSVADRMREDRTKNRVTVYYLLAEHFGKLGLFGGTTAEAGDGTGAATGTAGAAGIAALAGSGVSPAAHDDPTGATDIGRGAAAGATAAGAAGFAALGGGDGANDDGIRGGGSGGTGSGGGSRPLGDLPDDRGGGSWFGKWWPWLLLALALILLVLLLRSCQNNEAGLTDANTSVENLTGSDAGTVTGGDLGNVTDEGLGNMAGEDLGNVSANAAAAAPAAVPAGAAVTAETRNGLPALNVYFETGKAAVASGFADKAADVKAYVASHPGAKLAVSGFNDPTGNAALNAELSKNRAQAVAAALKSAGIPEDAVVLEKPAETTLATGDNAAARRVEVTVRQ